MARTYKLRLQGNSYDVKILRHDDESARLLVNGSEYSVEILREEGQASKTPRLERTRVIPETLAKPQVTEKPGAAIGVGLVKSPLPGIVLKLHVRVGDKVQAGQSIMVMEAMKMENEIRCAISGTVQELRVKEGDSVLESDVLAVIQQA
ncbi:MAG: biotin/lipoyl-containing protein [Candidatus Delongbacteria bacterium]